MARLYLCLLLVLCCIDSLAQRRLVVVDMDLLVPVAGANVVSRQGVQTTDSMGVVVWRNTSITIWTILLQRQWKSFANIRRK